MGDSLKKVVRSFQCREALWTEFESMAGDLECSVDYLLNEAMKRFVRDRNRRTPTPIGQAAPPEVPAFRTLALPAPPLPPPAHSRPPSPAAVLAPPLPHAPSALPPLPHAPSALPPLPHAPSALPPVLPASSLRAPVASVASPPAWMPPLPPPPGVQGLWRGPAPPVAPPPRLTIVYGGRGFAVDKDRYIIGRGRTMADLTIKDPNVSRQHAMVEIVGGRHFLVDMGSTNGIDHAAGRVTRRPIEEGDVVSICGHDIRFTFR